MQLRSRKTTKSSTTSCCAIRTSRLISSTFRNRPLEGATTSERMRTTPTPQELTFSTTKTAILSGFAHTQFQVLELHSYTLSTDLFIINSMGPRPSVSRPQPCVEGPWLGTTVGYAGVVSFILFHIIILFGFDFNLVLYTHHCDPFLPFRSCFPYHILVFTLPVPFPFLGNTTGNPGVFRHNPHPFP